VCVYARQLNLKTIGDIRFLLGSYVDRRQIPDGFARRHHKSKSFFGGFKRYITFY